MSFSSKRKSLKNEKNTSSQNDSHDGMNNFNTKMSRNSSIGTSRNGSIGTSRKGSISASRNMRDNGSVRSKKRQSQVFIAAQSLDLELQNVNHLKRMSIGSMDDTHMDPEMYYTVAATTTTHPSVNRANGNDYQQLEYLNMNMNLKTPRNSMISEAPVSYSDLYSFSETETDSDGYTNSESENDRNFSYESDADSLQQTINSYESNDEDGIAGGEEEEGEEDDDDADENDHHNMSYNKTGHEYLDKNAGDLDASTTLFSEKALDKTSNSLLQKRRSIHSKRTLSNRSSFSNRIASQGSSIKSNENNSLFSNENGNTHHTKNNDNDEENSIQSLLWVPANKHPSVKPENYIEFVQDKLHHLKIDTQNLNNDEENKTSNKIGNYQNFADSRKSTISRRPSTLRKSYTEFDTTEDGDGTESENTFNENSTEDSSSLADQSYSPNTTRKISLQQITDELTKLSKKAGIIGTDAASLARSLSMSTTNPETNSFDDEDVQEHLTNVNRETSINTRRSGSIRRNKSMQRTTQTGGANTHSSAQNFSTSRKNSINRKNSKKANSTPSRKLSLGGKDTDYRSDEDGFASNIMNEQPGTNSSSPSSSVSSASSNTSLRTDSPTNYQGLQSDKNPDQIIKGPQRSVLQRSKFTTYRQKSLNKRIGSASSASSSASSSPSGTTWISGNSATSPLTQTQFQNHEIEMENEPSKLKDDTVTETECSFDSSNSAMEEEEEEEEEEDDDDEDEDDDLSSMVTADDGSDNQDASFDSTNPTPGRSLSPNKDLLKNDYLQKVSHARNRHMIAGARERVLEQDRGTKYAQSGEDSEENRKEVAGDGSAVTKETPDEDNLVKRKKTRFMSMIRRHIRPDTKNKLKFSKETQPKVENIPVSTSLSTPPSESAAKNVSLPRSTMVNDNSKEQTSLQPAVNVISSEIQNNSMKNVTKSRKDRTVSVDVYGDMVLELEQENFLDDMSTSDEGPARAPSQSDSIGYGNGRFDKNGDDQETGLDESQSIRTSETSIQSDDSSGSSDNTPSLQKYSHSSDAQPQRQTGLDNINNNNNNNKSSRGDAEYTWSSRNESASGTLDYATSDESENSIDPESPMTLETSSPSPSIAAPTPLPPRKLRYEDVIRSEKPNSPMVYRDSSFGFPLPPLTISTVIMFDQRLPVSMERAIYRLSHMKLSDSKRELRQQVLLSNFMYSYLNLVNHSLYLQKLEEEMV